MKAAVLFEALALLRTVKDLPVTNWPVGLDWYRVMTAHNLLERELSLAGLQVAVEAPQAEQVVA